MSENYSVHHFLVEDLLPLKMVEIGWSVLKCNDRHFDFCGYLNCFCCNAIFLMYSEYLQMPFQIDGKERCHLHFSLFLNQIVELVQPLCHLLLMKLLFSFQWFLFFNNVINRFSTFALLSSSIEGISSFLLIFWIHILVGSNRLGGTTSAHLGLCDLINWKKCKFFWVNRPLFLV